MKIMIWKGVTIQNQFKFLNQGPPANIMIDDDNHGSIDVKPSIATMANGHTYNFHFLMTWTHLTIGPGRS